MNLAAVGVVGLRTHHCPAATDNMKAAVHTSYGYVSIREHTGAGEKWLPSTFVHPHSTATVLQRIKQFGNGVDLRHFAVCFTMATFHT